MKKLFATLLALALLASCCAALAEAPKFEGEGYDSPEAAVEAYIEAFNAGDAWGMLSTFAVETAVDHVDQKAVVERMHAWPPATAEATPVFNDYSRDVAILARVGQLVDSLRQSMLTYAWPEDYGEYTGATVIFKSDNVSEEIEAFYAGFAASDFVDWAGKVSVTGYLTPEELGLAELFQNEKNQTRIEQNRIMYGTDELAERAALLNVAGKQGVQFMQCARFGDRWYNYTTSGNLAILAGINKYCGGLLLAPSER